MPITPTTRPSPKYIAKFESMIRKPDPDTDQVARSLLQKAVRRGHLEMTTLAIKYLLQIDEFDWMRKRLAVITFEECWPFGLEVSFDNDKNIIINHYLKLTTTVKIKDAAGLGTLAYAYSGGDKTVLQNDSGDQAIQIIAEALKRPNDYWNWVRTRTTHDNSHKLVESADKGFRKAGWPWDRAFALSAAFLAITTEFSTPSYQPKRSDSPFPLWVAVDKHTQAGKEAIRDAARQINYSASKAQWISFYLESATCDTLQPSQWWERERNWRFTKLGLSLGEAISYWEMLKPLIAERVTSKVLELQNHLNSVSSKRLPSSGKQINLF